MNSQHDLYNFAQQNPAETVANLLRWYVVNDEPDGFCGEATTRAMCKVAASAIDGYSWEFINENWWEFSYCDTKYGSDLYFHMWGCDRWAVKP